MCVQVRIGGTTGGAWHLPGDSAKAARRPGEGPSPSPRLAVNCLGTRVPSWHRSLPAVLPQAPRRRPGPWATPAHLHLPGSPVHFCPVFLRVCGSDGGEAFPIAKGISAPSTSDPAARPPLTWSPATLAGLRTLCVCRRAGEGCIHRGCRSYVHCAYIYIYRIYIYILHSYIYCTEQ